MTKAELIDKIAEKTEGTKRESEKYFKAVIDSITEALIEGEKISILGFGTFSVSHREARDGRNPATGEVMHIEAKDVPTFKASSTLKDALNNK
jgi:DNA-binding protein HU-beta